MTDPIEQSRKWAEGLDASREQYDRRDFAVGKPFVHGQPAVPPMTKDERWLRESLAFCYCGSGLYADDGELQDSRMHPTIDFLRDPPEHLQELMRERADATVAKWSKVIADGGHLVPDGIHLDSAEKELLVRLLAAPTDDRRDATVRSSLLRKLGLDEAAEKARETLVRDLPSQDDFVIEEITYRAHWHCEFCKAVVVKAKEVNWQPTADTIIRPEDWLHPDGTPVLANDMIVCPECDRYQSIVNVNVMSQIKMRMEASDADEA